MKHIDPLQLLLSLNNKAILKMLHKVIIIGMLFLLGAALLDRDKLLYAGERLRYGEILFGIYMLISVVSKKAFARRLELITSFLQKKYSYYFIAFIIWTGLSWAVNTVFIDGDIYDLFGVTIRLLFYFLMTLYIAGWVKSYGVNIVVYPFCIGVLSMFCINYSVTVLEILTVPAEIPVTNFSAVMLPVCALYFVLSYFYKPCAITWILIIISYFATALVYSLGGYVFMAFGLPLIILAIKHFYSTKQIGRYKKTIASLFLLVIIVFVVNKFAPAFEVIYGNIEKKISNVLVFDDPSGNYRSFDYRWGHFISSMSMTIHNPMFGVGKHNWELENEKNKDWIKAHHTNDNPHNAIAQILSMYGVPAFIFFAITIYLVFRQLYYLKLSNKISWIFIVLSSLFVFIGTANVMDSFFNTYYFYFYAGIVFGIKDIQSCRIPEMTE